MQKFETCPGWGANHHSRPENDSGQHRKRVLCPHSLTLSLLWSGESTFRR
jgi:hypothetical protein